MDNGIHQKHPRQETDEIIPDYLQELYQTETYKLILDLRKGQIRTVALRAHTGKYVSAVNGGGGTSLHADKTYIGSDELFQIIALYPESIAIRTRNGHYVVAEEPSGLLRANRLTIGDWERFEIVPVDIQQRIWIY